MKGIGAFFAFCAIIFNFFYADAQKPLIGIGSEKWDNILGPYGITNDGKYIAYTISKSQGDTLRLRSTDSSWQIYVPGAIFIQFTQDSRKVIFKSKESIGIMNLISPNSVIYFIDVNRYQIVKQGISGDLLVYSKKSQSRELVVRDVEGERETSYNSIEEYWLSNEGNTLIMEMFKNDSAGGRRELNWLDIAKNKMRTIWQGTQIEDVKISPDGSQCVFLSSEPSLTHSAVWYYQKEQDDATKIIDSYAVSMQGITIRRIISFNEMSRKVFMEFAEIRNDKDTAIQNFCPINVWSYKDSVLQSFQLNQLKQKSDTKSYKVVLNLDDGNLMRLEQEQEAIISDLSTDYIMNYALLVKNEGGSPDEWNWNRKSLRSVFLIDLNNGKKHLIAADQVEGGSYFLSYNQHYVFYYDSKLKNYFSYHITDGLRKNMTAEIQCEWTNAYSATPSYNIFCPYQVAGLIKNGDAVLIYSRHDIFMIDPTSAIPAKNLTKITRQTHNLVFRLLKDSDPQIIDSNESIYLSVFNETNKDACITKIEIVPSTSIKTLNFQPYRFGSQLSAKAGSENIYLVQRENTDEYPNLFLTSDFKHYSAMTNIHPEREFNWMSSELVNWRTFDGSPSQGILYKPENFDPRNKYPLLIYYYERMSDDLHKFIDPDLSDGTLNIPYYVSHGYLVFIPDIHFKVGWPGKSAYNCVVSGVNYLTRRAYVDSKRMGIQGHSFAGYETNYLITHTHIFAAAVSCNGQSDFVSGYGSLSANGGSRQSIYESGQSRIGAPLSLRPDQYVANSPIFRTNYINTPILLLDNKEDGVVPFAQGIEFFTALRRLGKRAWLLQYDRENHSLNYEPAQKDFTIRMAQFFDHYLKGAQPPRWMTVGVPATLKQIDSGLQVDTTGKQP